jgi:hypothetical protein
MDKFYKSAKQCFYLTRMQNTNQINQAGVEVKEKMDMLAETIRDYNYTSTELRDTLRSTVPKPFNLDPLLTVHLNFDEPIPVNEFLAIELFNKHFIEISGVRIIDQSITFYFNTEDGEDSLEYTMNVYDNALDIELWQYYLISLVAPDVAEYVRGVREGAIKFINHLKEIAEKCKTNKTD